MSCQRTQCIKSIIFNGCIRRFLLQWQYLLCDDVEIYTTGDFENIYIRLNLGQTSVFLNIINLF